MLKHKVYHTYLWKLLCLAIYPTKPNIIPISKLSTHNRLPHLTSNMHLSDQSEDIIPNSTITLHDIIPLRPKLNPMTIVILFNFTCFKIFQLLLLKIYIQIKITTSNYQLRLFLALEYILSWIVRVCNQVLQERFLELWGSVIILPTDAYTVFLCGFTGSIMVY